LRTSVFEKLEVFFVEIADKLAPLISHDRAHLDAVGFQPNRLVLILLILSLKDMRRVERNQNSEQQNGGWFQHDKMLLFIANPGTDKFTSL